MTRVEGGEGLRQGYEQDEHLSSTSRDGPRPTPAFTGAAGSVVERDERGHEKAEVKHAQVRGRASDVSVQAVVGRGPSRRPHADW
jgi:hypothetical protein